MKKISKLDLNSVNNTELNERELCRILGGGTPGNCCCGCNYAGSGGGSSTSANDSANNAYGYHSSGCENNDGTVAGYNPWRINSNWDCDIKANCNSEPNKC